MLKVLPPVFVLFVLLALAMPGATQAGSPPTPEPTPYCTPTPPPPTATPTPEPTPTATPEPTPTPERWDKSSIKVRGACVQDVPVFEITNSGSGNMAAPSSFWFLNTNGGASDCAADVAANAIGTGYFQLLSGESVQVVYPKGDLDPPYRLCVAQALGHPGTGFASATIGEDEKCVTAEEEVAEPLAGGVSWLFVPWAGK